MINLNCEDISAMCPYVYIDPKWPKMSYCWFDNTLIVMILIKPKPKHYMQYKLKVKLQHCHLYINYSPRVILNS